MKKYVTVCDYCGKEIKEWERTGPHYSGCYSVNIPRSDEQAKAMRQISFIRHNGYEKDFHEDCHDRWMDDMLVKFEQSEHERKQRMKKEMLKEKLYQEYLESIGLKEAKQ